MAATRAVHVLTTIPLTDARGKTDVARELMLWPGARDYYRVGAGHRYLAVRGGVLSTSSPHHFHEWPTAPHAVQSSGIGRGGFRQSRATWPGRRHLLQSWFGQASARCASEAQRKQRMTFDWRAGLAPSVPSSK